jgi:hypothetical protein
MSTVAGLITARALPKPHGLLWVAWIGALIVVSQLVLRVVERLLRRLMPLPAMLRFTLAFPDEAPKRFATALRSGNVEKMRREMKETAENGLPENLSEAASTALRMVAQLNKHDRGTRGHSERVRAYSELLAEEMGLEKEFREKLRWGALLHDMGKLTVPAAILNKPGRPTEEEWAILQGHPAAGVRILAPLADWLGDAVHAAGQHHERWDGKGYPNKMAGEEISLSARIVAVADAFAVMTTARAYKKPLPIAVAREELTKNAGTQFDPDVVRAMLSVSIGRTSKFAGPMTTLANLPFVGSLLTATAPAAVPAVVSSGAAVVALTASLISPSPAKEWFWEQPVSTSIPNELAFSDASQFDTRPNSVGDAPRTSSLSRSTVVSTLFGSVTIARSGDQHRSSSFDGTTINLAVRATGPGQSAGQPGLSGVAGGQTTPEGTIDRQGSSGSSGGSPTTSDDFQSPTSPPQVGDRPSTSVAHSSPTLKASPLTSTSSVAATSTNLVTTVVATNPPTTKPPMTNPDGTKTSTTNPDGTKPPTNPSTTAISTTSPTADTVPSTTMASVETLPPSMPPVTDTVAPNPTKPNTTTSLPPSPGTRAAPTIKPQLTLPPIVTTPETLPVL